MPRCYTDVNRVREKTDHKTQLPAGSEATSCMPPVLLDPHCETSFIHLTQYIRVSPWLDNPGWLFSACSEVFHVVQH